MHPTPKACIIIRGMVERLEEQDAVGEYKEGESFRDNREAAYMSVTETVTECHI